MQNARRKIIKQGSALGALLVAPAMLGSKIATAQIAPTPNAPLTQGLFIFKLFGVTPVESQFSLKWTELTLKEKHSGRTVTIKDLVQVQNHSHFTALLDPGTYSISGISVPGPSVALWGFMVEAIIKELTTSAFWPGAQSTEFVVKAGDIVNLGAMVFGLTFDEKKNEKSAVKLIAAPLPPEINLGVALEGGTEQFRANLTSFLAAKQQALEPVVMPSVFPESLERFIPLSTRFGQAVNLKNGDVVVGAPMGLLLKRNKVSGSWSYHWSGRFEMIENVAELEDGRLVSVNGTAGLTVWEKDSLKATWRRFKNPKDFVVRLVSIGDAGVAMIRVDNFDHFGMPRKVDLVFRKDLEPDTPNEVVLELGLSAQGAMPLLWDGKRVHVYWPQQGFSRTTVVYKIDPITKAKEESKLATWAIGIRADADTWQMTRMNGMTFYVGHSIDKGQSWIMPEEAAATYPYMSDTQNGYGLKTLRSGWSAVEAVVVRTTNGGKLWQETKGVISFDQVASMRGVVFDDKEWVIMTLIQGMMRSADQGQSWAKFMPPLRG
jgi:hypothetical protein